MEQSMRTRPKVIAIVGPTGVGKTALSLKIAKKIGGEIVSADSRQVYRGLDIGTEKISREEMRGIPHHMLSVANPKQVYTVANFVRDGSDAIQKILARETVPIIVGGSGHYVDALLGISPHIPEVPPDKKLRAKLKELSPAKLFALLQKQDPVRTLTIDRYNPRRLIRALEIVQSVGNVPKIKTQQSPYQVMWIGLKSVKKSYKKVLKERLLKTIERGLLGEIKRLRKSSVSKKRINEFGLEYRIGLAYLGGQLTRGEMIEQMQKELRQYSKRQMTWFKRNHRIHWYSSGDMQRIVAHVHTFLS